MERAILHVCDKGTFGGPLHPCGKAASALKKANIPYVAQIAADGIPFGLFTSGRRPELKALSGQEKLPVLELEDGTTINGSGAIAAWAVRNARPAASQPS